MKAGRSLLFFLAAVAVILFIPLLITAVTYSYNRYRIYNDCGVLPFDRGSTVTEIDSRECVHYSKQDISAAMKSVTDYFYSSSSYEDKGFPVPDRNLFLTKLWYEDRLCSNDENNYKNEKGEQVIYIRSHLYHGNCGNGCGFNRYCMYTAGYWTLTRKNDSSPWKCEGWGQG